MNELDMIAAVMPEGVKLVPEGEVLAGQGEWLLDNSSATHIVQQVQGDILLAPKALRRWQFVLEGRAAWLARHSAHYVFAIAPTEHVVMRDKLPDNLLVSGQRPATQLVEHMASSGQAVSVIYPMDELLAEEKHRPTHVSHDSRWNGNGAFVAYERLVEEISQHVRVRRVGRDEVGFAWWPARGDLDHGLDEHEDEPRKALIGRPHPRTALLLHDTRVEQAGRMVITKCDQAPPVTGLLFGEGASYRMLTYLSETFRRFVFVHLPTLDYELVEAERPDVVLTLQDEASLIDLPADIEAPTAKEVAARKLASGNDLMPDLAPLWGQPPNGDSR